MKRFWIFGCIFFWFCSFSFVWAQGENSVDSYFRYMPAAKVSSQAGKINIIETNAGYSYEFKAFDKLPVKFSLEHDYVSIDNSTSLELPTRLVGLITDLETTLPFLNFNSTYLRIGLSPAFYGDNWDFPASSFRVPSRIFVIRKPNEQWTFLAGIAIYPGFEREVLPILGFIYKPNSRLTFNIAPKRPEISYELNNKVTLFTAFGGTFNSEFEVTKDNLKGVVLRYKEKHFGAGLKYKINNFIRASLLAGEAFSRSFKYRDSLGKIHIKDSAYVEFRLQAGI